MNSTQTFGRRPTLGEMREYYARDDVLSFLYDECQMRSVEFAFRQKRWPIKPNSKAHLGELIENEIRDKVERAYGNHNGPIDDIRLAKLDYLSFHSLTSIKSGEEEIGFDMVFEADMEGWRRSFEDLIGVVKLLDDFEVCYRMKYSGVRSLHFMIPFESFPREFRGKSVISQRKEIRQKIRRYFVKHCGMNRAHGGGVLRLAYSLNEDNGLVSVPVLSQDLASFRPWETNIYNVNIDKPWHGDIPPDAGEKMLKFLQEVYSDDRETGKSTAIWVGYGLEIAPKRWSGDTGRSDESSVNRWSARLKSEDESARVKAAWNLMNMSDPVPMTALEQGLTDTNPDVRWYLTEALQKRLDDEAISLAGGMLLDNDQLVRISAIDALVLAEENASRALLDSISGNVSGLSKGQLYDIVYAISKIELESQLKAAGQLISSDVALAGAIQQTNDAEMLDRPIMTLRGLGNPAVEMVLESAFASDAKLQGLASALLKHWLARYNSRSVWDIYAILNWLTNSPMDTKAKANLLIEMLEIMRIPDAVPLLTCVLLCYPDAAFPLLMERFWSIPNVGELGRYSRILHTLCRMGTRFGEALLESLSGGDIHQQALALAGLEELARALNLPQYKQSSPEELALTARLAERLAPPSKEYGDPIILGKIVDQVAAFLTHDNADLREPSIRIMGLMQAKAYVDQIRECLQHNESSTRVAAISALGEIGDENSIEVLLDAARNSEPTERRTAIEALSRLEAQEAQPVFIEAASDEDLQIKQAAIAALGTMGSGEARAKLQELVKSKDKNIAKAAAKALRAKQKSRQPSELARNRLRRIRGTASPVTDISVEMALRALPEARPYGQAELTSLIAQVCSDYAGTRRTLIMHKLMDRANDIYELTEWGKQLWSVERFIVENYMKS